jgi:O-antigen ligase
MANPRPNSMRISTDALRLSLAFLVVLTISRFHQHYPAIAALRPGLIATGLVGIYAFLNPGLLARGNILRTWPAKLMAAFFVLACLSTAFGISMGNSGKYILDSYMKTVIFGFLTIACIRNVRDLYTLGWALVISCAIISGMALFVFQLTIYDGYARLDDLYTYDANDVGCVLVACIGLVMVHVSASRPVGRITSFAVLIMMCAAIARTGSRGALVGLVAAGVALLVLAQGKSFLSRLLISGAAVVGLSLWAPPGYWSQMETILNPKDDYNYTSVDGRKQVAERGMQYMLTHPFAGVGIANFDKAECTISEMAVKYRGNSPLRCTPPHNSAVQAGAEMGIPGLILWGVFLGGGIFGPIALRRRLPKWWKRGDAEERYIYAATVYFPVTYFAFAVSSLFLTFAWMDFTYLLIAFLAGLFMAAEYKLRQNLMYPPPPELVSRATGRRRSGVDGNRYSPPRASIPKPISA